MIDLPLSLFALHGYAIVFVAILLDNAGLPIPGELLLLIFGVLARNGDLDPMLGLLTASAAAMSGDGIGYWLGRLSGERVLHTYCWLTLGSGKCVRKAVDYYRLHGRATVIFGRFVIGVRAFLSPLAGSAGLPFAEFLLFDALGALTWSGLFIALGYGLGWGPERVHASYRIVSMALLTMVGVALVAYVVVKLTRRRRHGVASLGARGIARVGRSLNLNPILKKESPQCVRISERQS
jgi:membrane protein DedA with SNARE-associated domain